MKNNIFKIIIIVFLTFFVQGLVLTEELNIKSTSIKIDKNKKLTIFKGNVKAIDSKNNQLFSDQGTYYKDLKKLITSGETKIITSEGYKIYGSNISFDDTNKIISSNEDTKIIDNDGNIISVKMFDYLIEKNTFFSKGNINIKDINKNEYNFSEIYIDEKKNKIVGTDVKAFLNQEDLKVSNDNEPRFFANSMTLTKEKSEFQKGVFTYCKNRGKDKCPPWQLQAKKIEHDPSTKTIYYDNAVLKIYDFPIFFFPKLWHPDPTVKRQSGFLPPSLSDSSNVGTGITAPYFWAMAKDRDLTFTPKLYASEKPLLLAEYRQEFKNSFLITDVGFTQGYKKRTDTKSKGSRSHFFSKFNHSFSSINEANSELELNIQRVSNRTHLKVHDINTALVDKDTNILENTLTYNYQNEDLFLGSTISAFESLSKNENDRSRFEYLLPYITFDKNLATDERYGALDFSSNLQIRNFDVNKQTEFFVNDLNWKSNKWINNIGIQNSFEGLLKTVNYSAKNTSKYKNQNNNAELSGVIGYLAKLNLFKNDLNSNNLLTPKFLLRYAPGHMRAIDSGRLKYSNLFNLNKLDTLDIIEKGLSTSLGFDYKKNDLDSQGIIGPEKFSFSAGQVISANEYSDIPSSSSLDQRFSDVVGESSYNINEKIKLNYSFSLDQSYKEFNYNELGSELSFGDTKFNLSYLEEKNHIGSQEYVKSSIDITLNDSANLTLSTKRNLVTNSAEFYDLSYDYINDCLKAGLVYRREFYSDRDVEPENSLMFRVTFVPLTSISSPTFNK